MPGPVSARESAVARRVMDAIHGGWHLPDRMFGVSVARCRTGAICRSARSRRASLWLTLAAASAAVLSLSRRHTRSSSAWSTAERSGSPQRWIAACRDARSACLTMPEFQVQRSAGRRHRRRREERRSEPVPIAERVERHRLDAQRPGKLVPPADVAQDRAPARSTAPESVPAPIPSGSRPTSPMLHCTASASPTRLASLSARAANSSLTSSAIPCQVSPGKEKAWRSAVHSRLPVLGVCPAGVRFRQEVEGQRLLSLEQRRRDLLRPQPTGSTGRGRDP